MTKYKKIEYIKILFKHHRALILYISNAGGGTFGSFKKMPKCHEIIDPTMDYIFDELSKGVWHLIHSGNLDSENPNNWRFD